MFRKIEKRNGEIVEFDAGKISSAILKAGRATGEFGQKESKNLTRWVLALANERGLGPIPKVEGIQDIVESVLIDSPFNKTAKAYILYLKVLKARWAMAQGTIEDQMQIGQLAQEMIDMAPENSSGYVWLGWYYWLDFVSMMSQDSLVKACELANKALSMDKSDAGTYRLLGSIYLFMKQYEKAIVSGQKAIDLEPSAADSHLNLGLTLSYAGPPDEGISQINQAIRLTPLPPYFYYVCLGRCYIRKGNYEEALEQFKKAVEVAPDSWMSHFGTAVSYSLLDREQEARSAAKKVLEIQPFFSVDFWEEMVPFRNLDDLKKVAEAMRKAGL